MAYHRLPTKSRKLLTLNEICIAKKEPKANSDCNKITMLSNACMLLTPPQFYMLRIVLMSKVKRLGQRGFNLTTFPQLTCDDKDLPGT